MTHLKTDAVPLPPSQILHPESLSLTTVKKFTPFRTYSPPNHRSGNVLYHTDHHKMSWLCLH